MLAIGGHGPDAEKFSVPQCGLCPNVGTAFGLLSPALFTAIRRRAFNTARSVPGQVRHEHRMLFGTSRIIRTVEREEGARFGLTDANIPVYLAHIWLKIARKTQRNCNFRVTNSQPAGRPSRQVGRPRCCARPRRKALPLGERSRCWAASTDQLQFPRENPYDHGPSLRHQT